MERKHSISVCQHLGMLTKYYWVGATEVNQKQYNAVMGMNPIFVTVPFEQLIKIKKDKREQMNWGFMT